MPQSFVNEPPLQGGGCFYRSPRPPAAKRRLRPGLLERPLQGRNPNPSPFGLFGEKTRSLVPLGLSGRSDIPYCYPVLNHAKNLFESGLTYETRYSINEYRTWRLEPQVEEIAKDLLFLSKASGRWKYTHLVVGHMLTRRASEGVRRRRRESVLL